MQGLVELEPQGNVVVVGNLHGRVNILKQIVEKSRLIKNFSRGTCFICTGDFVHALNERDYSIETIEYLSFLKERFPNRVFILLGNHEWSHVANVPIHSNGDNLNAKFMGLLEGEFGLKAGMKLREYASFFRTLPLAVRIGRMLISHAAPDMSIMDSSEFNSFDPLRIKSINDKFYPMLWACPKELLTDKGKEHTAYDEDDVELFLGRMEAGISVVSNENVNKFYQIGKQLIVNSMNGAYLELDMSRDYRTVKDLESAKRTV